MYPGSPLKNLHAVTVYKWSKFELDNDKYRWQILINSFQKIHQIQIVRKKYIKIVLLGLKKMNNSIYVYSNDDSNDASLP